MLRSTALCSLALLAVPAAGQGARAQALESLTLNPTSVTGSVSATGTVTLTSAPILRQDDVALESADPALVAVPAQVSILRGRTSTPFQITTRRVTSRRDVVITATRGAV